MKRISLIVTLALLIVALCAGMALASPPTLVAVNGVQIYGGSPNGSVDGVSYDRNTNTLTLDGANITKEYKYDTYDDYYAGIYADGDLNIVLRGSNSIKLPVNNYDLYYGVIIQEGDLTVSGGSLFISAVDYGLNSEDGDITIDNSELSITTEYYEGILADDNITITGSDLNITAKGYGNGYGICSSDGNLTIDNSELIITADGDGIFAYDNIAITDSRLNITAGGDGINTFYFDITIDKSVLNITAGEDGIYANSDIAIDNSELNITAGAVGIYVNKGDATISGNQLTVTADGYGIYTDRGDITIDNSQLTIIAGYSGIYAYNNIVISGSELTVTADGHGIYIYSGDIIISDSELTVTAGEIGICVFVDITIIDSWVKTTGGEWKSGIDALGIIDINNSYVLAEGGSCGMFAYHFDENYYTISTSDGIVYNGVIVTRGGQVVKVYNESYLFGYTFSATHQRAMWEWSEDDEDIVISHGAAKIVELVPTAEMMQLVIPILSGTGKNFPFVDVGLNHWAYQNIFDAFKKGLINGKTETLYLPDGPLTYAEAIKLAACIHQLNSMGAVSFEASQPWYDTYVRYAELNQIILPGEFAGKYNDAIIRYDFAHIFGKALPLSAFTPLNAIDSIPDVPASNRHADEILMLYRAGILTGSDAAGTFNGNSNIKRSEVAAIVVRMIDPARRIVK